MVGSKIMETFILRSKWIMSFLLLAVVVSYHGVVAQDLFQCPVCGEGTEITVPDGIVELPQDQVVTCSQLADLAAQGNIDEQTCVNLETFVQDPCGCQSAALDGNATAAPTIFTTAAPSMTPSAAPSFGPEPDCYEDLNNIGLREKALSTDQVAIGRTYVLCPDTVFFMGILNQNIFEGGFDAIIPRPNVHYKCGTSGSSTNNCRLLTGSAAILSAAGDPLHSNVTFEGLTIESSVVAGVVAALPGDLTFVDCIFKNHENKGPVLALYAPPAQEGDGTRQLQGSGGLTTLTLTFIQCLFVGNKLAGGTQTGMISSVTPETILNFDDVTFYNNDYGDSTVSDSAAAILSRGPLTVRNACFITNAFVGDAPIVSIGGSALDVVNTYIDEVDDALACSLAASYVNQSDWEIGSIGDCITSDINECQSTVDLKAAAPSAPSPAGGPTRIPVPQVTLSPQVPPTQAPVGSDAVSRSSVRTLSGVYTVAALLGLLGGNWIFVDLLM